MKQFKKLAYVALSAAFVASVLAVPVRAQEPPPAPPTIGPEIELNDEIAYGGSTAQQYEPSVAWGDGRGLVVFTDNRGGTDIGGDGYDIFGSIVDATGSPFGPQIHIGRLSGWDRAPRVVWNGARYMVTWVSGEGAETRILAARVSADGEVQDETPKTIARTGVRGEPDIATKGRWFLITWPGKVPGSDSVTINAKRISAGAGIRDRHPIVVGSTGLRRVVDRPSLLWKGRSYVVMWERQSKDGRHRLEARRVFPSGKVDPFRQTVVALPGKVFHPDIAWNGTSLLAAWTRVRPGRAPQTRVEAVRLSANLRQVGTPRVVARDPPRVRSHVALSAHGSRFLIGWTRAQYPAGAAIRTSLLSPQGDSLRGAVQALSAEEADPPGLDLAKANGQHILVWSGPIREEEVGATDWDVFAGQLVAESGTVLERHEVSRAPRFQRGVQVVAGDDVFLVVWRDTPGLLAARVSPEGALLDDPPILIDVPVGEHSVTWDGENFVVGYMTVAGFGLTRVTPQGVILQKTAVAVAEPKLIMDMASGGGRTVIVWNAYGPHYFRMFDENLVPLHEESRPLANDPSRSGHGADTVWSGDRFLNVLMEKPPGSFEDVDPYLHVRSIDIDGDVGDEGIVEGPERPWEPAFSNGDGAGLLQWVEDENLRPSRTELIGASVHAAPVDDAGKATTPPSEVEDSTTRRYGNLSAAWTGAGYLSVWNEVASSGGTTGYLLRGRQLSSKGSPIAGTEFQIGIDQRGFHAAESKAVASIPGGPALVVYERGVADSPFFGVRRAFARVLDPQEAEGDS